MLECPHFQPKAAYLPQSSRYELDTLPTMQQEKQETSLARFTEAQVGKYEDAYRELVNGRKTSHWMWYIFPIIDGLGHSETAKFYALRDMVEAQDYFNHPVLGRRLVDISTLLLGLEGRSAHDIFGPPDDFKLQACMTLFSFMQPTVAVFEQVLSKYFEGRKDPSTLAILRNKGVI